MKHDAFLECQKSIVSELTLVIEELKAGMYESVYKKLTDLNDELIADIRISEKKEPDSLTKD